LIDIIGIKKKENLHQTDELHWDRILGIPSMQENELKVSFKNEGKVWKMLRTGYEKFLQDRNRLITSQIQRLSIRY
jgi:hypothetical protein